MGHTGGRSGIRTHGALITHDGFQDRCIKPDSAILPYLTAVFDGNGKTLYYSGGVSSILDSLQTIIGNILRFVDYGGLIVSHPWLCYAKNYKRKLPSSSATPCLLQSRLSTRAALDFVLVWYFDG